MIVPAPREILITKENKFTMDIHNDMGDDIVQHQEIERKHYNDGYEEANSYTISVGQQERLQFAHIGRMTTQRMCPKCKWSIPQANIQWICA
jgi:hypothetical protein